LASEGILKNWLTFDELMQVGGLFLWTTQQWRN